MVFLARTLFYRYTEGKNCKSIGGRGLGGVLVIWTFILVLGSLLCPIIFLHLFLLFASFIFSPLRIRFLLNSHVCRISLIFSFCFSTPFPFLFSPFFYKEAAFLWFWDEVLGSLGILRDSA